MTNKIIFMTKLGPEKKPGESRNLDNRGSTVIVHLWSYAACFRNLLCTFFIGTKVQPIGPVNHPYQKTASYFRHGIFVVLSHNYFYFFTSLYM